MNLTNLKNAHLPESPGVYFFLDKRKKILYIGKATSLKNRVKSYFTADIIEKRSALIAKMVFESTAVDFTETDSVLEALILETNLIRTHKPHYNTKSKDDKSYNHLIITNEEWPRVLVVRERDLTYKFADNEIKDSFGPFTSPTLLRDALKIVRKLFQYYDTKKPVDSESTKFTKGIINFNRQIGLYPDPNQKQEYKTTIRHIRLLFQGKKHKIILELEKEMKQLAKLEKFELAQLKKKQIFALKHIEDISLIKADKYSAYDKNLLRVEAYDVAHHAGQDMVGVMVVVAGSEPVKSEYRKFKIKTLKSANDPAALVEMLERRLKHPEWPFPSIIAVDGNEIQINAARKVLEKLNLNIPVVSVVKDDRHKASRVIAPPDLLKKYKYDILLANSEAHRFAIGFYRKLANKRMKP